LYTYLEEPVAFVLGLSVSESLNPAIHVKALKLK